jgi:hypothetical protein
MKEYTGGKMFRLVVLLVTLLFITPASAESTFEASMKRALTEAHCPPYSRGEAVRAAVCRSIAMRPVIGPASLVNFEPIMEDNIETARKFDDGKITTEQYIAEIRAQWEDFATKNEEDSQDAEREHRQEQCNGIIETIVTPWITAEQEAAALEQLRSLGCLK